LARLATLRARLTCSQAMSSAATAALEAGTSSTSELQTSLFPAQSSRTAVALLVMVATTLAGSMMLSCIGHRGRDALDTGRGALDTGRDALDTGRDA